MSTPAQQPAAPTADTTGPAAATPTPPPRNRRWAAWLAFVLLAIAAGIYGFHDYQFAVTHEVTDDAIVEAHVVYIAPRIPGHVETVSVVSNQFVEAGQVLATLDARDAQNELSNAESALRAAEAACDVARCDAELTEARATAALNAAEAKLSAAKAQTAATEGEQRMLEGQEKQSAAMANMAQAMIEAARADIAAAQVERDRDAADLKRFQALVEHESVSRQQADHAAASADISAAKLKALEDQVAAREKGLLVAQAALAVARLHSQAAGLQVLTQQSLEQEAAAARAAAQTVAVQTAAAKAKVKACEAAVAQAQTQAEKAHLHLSYTQIIAPSAGQITRKSVEPGAYLQPGQAMFAIVSREVWVTANFKETQLYDIQIGQPVTIYADAYPGVAYHAHIDSIQSGTGSTFALLPPENATGNYVKVVQRVPVKIRFDNPAEQTAHPLVPGMSVTPEVDITAKGTPHPPATPQPAATAKAP